jgi:hypothetical protein
MDQQGWWSRLLDRIVVGAVIATYSLVVAADICGTPPRTRPARADASAARGCQPATPPGPGG